MSDTEREMRDAIMLLLGSIDTQISRSIDGEHHWRVSPNVLQRLAESVGAEFDFREVKR